MNKAHRIRELIERLARINSADEWSDGLNPTQLAALSYLHRANRFSRSPSQVADFLTATRGTVSQTLKALARKGLIEEVRSETDRRWTSYNTSKTGEEAVRRLTAIEQAIDELDPEAMAVLADSLDSLLKGALKARGNKPFGQCKSCRYHRSERAGGYCMLLNERLTRQEAEQICHEYEDAA